jgi:hypothetical protein
VSKNLTAKNAKIYAGGAKKKIQTYKSEQFFELTVYFEPYKANKGIEGYF